MLLDLVATGDSEVDAAFADEGGDVGRGQEDEREREVLDECDVQARVAVELDIGAVEEVEADLVEAALCAQVLLETCVAAKRGGERLTLRDREEQSVVEAVAQRVSHER